MTNQSYNPNEPRDERGRWTSGGSAGSGKDIGDLFYPVRHAGPVGPIGPKGATNYASANAGADEQARQKRISDLESEINRIEIDIERLKAGGPKNKNTISQLEQAKRQCQDEIDKLNGVSWWQRSFR